MPYRPMNLYNLFGVQTLGDKSSAPAKYLRVRRLGLGEIGNGHLTLYTVYDLCHMIVAEF